MRVRAEDMRKRLIEINVLDVDPESNTELVKKAMEKSGEVQEDDYVGHLEQGPGEQGQDLACAKQREAAQHYLRLRHGTER